MGAQACGIQVRMPDRAEMARSSYQGARKPQAQVLLELEDGGSRTVLVPVRVARALNEQEFPFPCEVDEACERIGALESRLCFTVLTEMISRREYSVEEARGKLALYGYRPADIDAAISRACDLRFLDDVRFVSGFIEGRKQRGWGRRKIEAELKRRGIDPARIEGYPDAYFDEEDDLARARALLARKTVPESKAYEKLVRHLMAKGFSYAIASTAVREVLAEDGLAR